MQRTKVLFSILGIAMAISMMTPQVKAAAILDYTNAIRGNIREAVDAYRDLRAEQVAGNIPLVKQKFLAMNAALEAAVANSNAAKAAGLEEVPELSSLLNSLLDINDRLGDVLAGAGIVQPRQAAH